MEIGHHSSEKENSILFFSACLDCFVHISFDSCNMVSEELRNLIVSQVKDGRNLSEMALIFKTIRSTTTLYRVGKDISAEVEKRLRKEQKHPIVVTSKMVAQMLEHLTTAKKHYSSRLVCR
jgi:hypothetical protein